MLRVLGRHNPRPRGLATSVGGVGLLALGGELVDDRGWRGRVFTITP
jgi:hypothetical protein